MTDLKKGDLVNVRGSFGGFVFDAKRDTDSVLIAGGIGVAPFMSMIQYAAATHLSNRLTLIYSCKDQDDVPFFEQLKEFEKSDPNFNVIFVISRGPIDKFAGQMVKTGRITPELINQAVKGDYDKKSFFICGPPIFMHAMSQGLRHKGVPEDRIMSEAFSQGSKRKHSKILGLPFKIYVFSAIGLAMASVAVLASDIVKSLPNSSLFGPAKGLTDSSTASNNRQGEIDKLVNDSPSSSSSAQASDAANNIPQTPTAAESTTSAPAAAQAVPAPVRTAPAATPAPAPAPAPTPAPAPVTSKSGV